MKILTITKIIFVMFLWAICFPLITIGIEYAPHLTFATMRAIISGAILLGLALALRRSFPCGWKSWFFLTIIGFGTTSLGYFGMFHAAEFVSPGVATVIANTQPLLAAGLASVILGERLTKWGKLGLVLGFLGIVIIATPQLFATGRESYAIGVLYIILAAIGITISNVVLKWIADTVDPVMTIGLQFLIGSVPLAIIAIITEDVTLVYWSVDFIFSLFGLAVFGSALVYVIWMSVLSEVSLSKANAFSFLVPMLGLAVGLLFYDEHVGWLELLGIFLAVTGVAIVVQKGIVNNEHNGIAS